MERLAFAGLGWLLLAGQGMLGQGAGSRGRSKKNDRSILPSFARRAHFRVETF
jgi:hypothetical protein